MPSFIGKMAMIAQLQLRMGHTLASHSGVSLDMPGTLPVYAYMYVYTYIPFCSVFPFTGETDTRSFIVSSVCPIK